MLAVSCLLGAPFLTTLAFDSFVRASFCCSCACVLILVGGAVCADCGLCSCVCIVVVCESVKASALTVCSAAAAAGEVSSDKEKTRLGTQRVKREVKREDE